MSDAPQGIAQAVPLGSFYHSLEIAKLADALAKAQSQFEPVVKDTKNPFFKSMYADLATLIAATKKGLCANGLSVIQSPGRVVDNKVQITSLLLHSSGQWMRSETEMPMSKADAQGMGSAITYGRRYAYQSLLNVAGETDDDGSAAVGSHEKAKETNNEYDQRTDDQRVVMPAQATAMHEAMKRTGKTEAQVTEYLKTKNYKQFEQVLRSDFQEILKWLNAPIAAKADYTPDLKKSVRDAVNKRLWAAVAEKSIPEDDVKKYSYERFGVDSMTKLSVENLKDVTEWIGTLA